MHPTPPSADVCTTLPPGNLPMRDASRNYPYTNWHSFIATESACGRVKRNFSRQFGKEPYNNTPGGAWNVIEMREDATGGIWARRDRGVYYVVDDFGFLARVDGKGGAA